MNRTGTVATAAFVTAALALSLAPATGADEEKDSNNECVATLTEISITGTPILTHLQNVPGSGDGLAIWANGAIEAAFFDWQRETDDGDNVYLVTGITSQYTCLLTCVLPEADKLDWLQGLSSARDGESLENALGAPPCHHDGVSTPLDP